jgi:purine-nucleoside phosphorylase
VLRLFGAEMAIVTAAAGGLNPTLAPGDLLLVRDHIGLPTLTGAHPLVGPNDERFGPRFPPLDGAYDEGLRALARAAACEQGAALREGVYVMVAGPSYETRAEVCMLRLLGGDAVGMPTVPEVVAARHLGMRVLGVCCISNAAVAEIGIAVATVGEPDHAQVLAVADRAAMTLGTLLEGVLTRL